MNLIEKCAWYIYIYIYLDSAMKRLLEIILNLMIMKIAKVILLFLILFSIVQKGKSFGLCYIFVFFPDYNKERTWVWPVSTGMIIPQWQINYLEKVYLKNKSLVCVCYFRFFPITTKSARECGRSADDDHSSMENILLRKSLFKK